MDVLVIALLIVYALAIGFIFLQSISDAHLIYHYIRAGKKKVFFTDDVSFQPFVTIQLPVYNELYVSERLINAVAQLQYPKDKFEIQVIDDSSDETTILISDLVTLWKSKGIQIHHVRRNSRVGFKAGALKYALKIAQGELLAIFDADFIPAPDFLIHTVPSFQEKKIGMVQVKWAHVNKNESLLTRLQALALDGHFSIEQHGRNAAGCFINFNGTAGIWRRQCIIDAGNWQADTLTEDLDLSYRAQLKGWKFKYLENVLAPAELPPVMSAFKSQQYRWTKGGAETAKKHLPALLRSSFPFHVKWHGFFHLLNNIGFVSIITCAILTVPLIFIKEYYPEFGLYFKLATFTVVCFIVFSIHYLIAYNKGIGHDEKKSFSRFVKRFPVFMSLYMGLSLNNSVGVLRGYFGKKSSFIRTPKFNTSPGAKGFSSNKYLEFKWGWQIIAEGFLSIYFLFGLAYAIWLNNLASIPFLSMAFIGFSLVFYMSISERRMIRLQNKV